ncbi:MAG: hypothetical protein AB1894_25250 [Chloroflexota bacterium]
MKVNLKRWLYVLVLPGLLLGLACNLPVTILAASTGQPEGTAVGQVSPSPKQTMDEYPGPGSGGAQPLVVSETPVIVTATILGVYPGVDTTEAVPTISSETPASSTQTPLPTETTPVASVTVSVTAALTDTQSAGSVYPGPGSQSPGSTATLPSASPTASLTAASGDANMSTPQPTATPLPTISPTLTSTASLTPTITATPTRTPVPLPPWVSSELHATDPGTVKLASGKVQLVEFFAFWDGASLAMAPIVHGLEARYQGQVTFIYLDVDDPGTLVFQDALNYRVMPHYFLLDGAGQVLWQAMGYVSVDVFIEQIDMALSK